MRVPVVSLATALTLCVCTLDSYGLSGGHSSLTDSFNTAASASTDAFETTSQGTATGTGTTGDANLCGNGVTDQGEECDGEPNDCSETCTWLPGAAEVALSGSRTCARLHNRNVACWGYGAVGGLGYGVYEISIGDDEFPSSQGFLDLGGAAVQISMGSWHSCAVLDGGDTVCWGSNYGGQLGYPGESANVGDYETPASVGPVDVGGKVVRVAAGGNHTCALLDDGRVRCWGEKTFGVLGYPDPGIMCKSCDDGPTCCIGDDEAPALADPVQLTGTIQEIAAGMYHNCALRSTGTVTCWGGNNDGQLGYGDTTTLSGDEIPADLELSLGGPAVQVVAGTNHNCALRDDHTVICWGDNSFGQLGLGHVDDVGDSFDELPLSMFGVVDIGGGALQVAAGGAHTCALREDGEVLCWGLNSSGQLGYGHTDSLGDEGGETPASIGPVPIGAKVAGIAAGGAHTCVWLDAGEIRCWGSNAYGGLGYGNIGKWDSCFINNNFMCDALENCCLGDAPSEIPPPDVPFY